MGYAVLHLDKASGNDAAMSAHIERTTSPKNADKTRTHLNRELITPPDGVTSRTEAIQHRIDTAGITRKVSHNQVRAIRVMLSGSPEDMQRIEETGQLDNWCNDNIDWLKRTFGKENLVSAVLHLDEKTPHIHATVVPIVTGERRKAKSAKQEDGRRKYKKKNPNTARLCVDDVMNRNKLKYYQDSYAEVMNKYGLNRGIDGSQARHITTRQYYRELYLENESLKEDIVALKEEQQEVYDKTRDLYDRKNEAREKFLVMDSHVRQKDRELANIEVRLQKARQEYEPYRAQEELNLMYELFPMMREQLRIADFCKKIGLAVESIKSLLAGKTLTAKSFPFFSPEHKQKFTAENISLKIEKERDNPNMLQLNLNGVNILEWFRQKYREFQQGIGIRVRQEARKGRGIKM